MASRVRIVGSSFLYLKKKKRGSKLQLDLTLEKDDRANYQADIFNIFVFTKEMQVLGGGLFQQP